MRKRDLTKEELNLVVQFFIDGYNVVNEVEEVEEFEDNMRADIENSVILSAVDTPYGVYIVIVSLLQSEFFEVINNVPVTKETDKWLNKEVNELLIRNDGSIVDVHLSDSLEYRIEKLEANMERNTQTTNI